MKLFEPLIKMVGGFAGNMLILLMSIFLMGNAIAAEKVSLQLRWDHQSQFAGYYAAQWQGYYAEAGFEVEIRSAIKPDGTIISATQEVGNGHADFGVGAADILIARDQDIPLVVLASIFQQSAGEFYAREGTPLQSPVDLLKLRVARIKNDVIDIELQTMLRSEGIDPNQVTPYPHEPGIDHLMAGLVDVIPGYQITLPYVFRQQGIPFTTLRPINYGIDFYGDSLFTHIRWIERDPQAVQRFVEATLKGWAYALEHPVEIADKISQDLPQTDRIFHGTLNEFNRFQMEGVKQLILHPLLEIGHINPHRWRRMHELMRTVGIIKQPLVIDELIFDPIEAEYQRKHQKAQQTYAYWRIALYSVTGLILLIFFWSLTLRKTLAQKTRDLREANQQLQDNVLRLQVTTEAGKVGLWDWDLLTNQVFYSAEWKRQIGYQDHEIANHFMEWQSRVHPDDLDRTLRTIQAFIEKPWPNYTQEFRFSHRDGSYRWILTHAALIQDAQGKVLRMLGSHIDITESKQAEEALRRSEEQYRAVIETSPDGFWITDAQGHLLEANEAYARLSGYSRDELRTMTASDLEASENPAEVAAHIKTICEQGNDLFQSQHRAKSGRVWQAEISTTYWPIKDGRLFVFIRDIYRRQRSEALIKVRMHLSEIARTGSLDDILRAALDVTERFTGSQIGFFHFVDPDQETLTLQTWSSHTLNTMCKAEGKGLHYPISQAGVWTDCIRQRQPVIHNDYASLPHQKGLPEGHAPVIRELTVPILRNDQVVAIIGVGNKPEDYTNDDVDAVQVLADLLIDAVERKQAEEALRESEERLQLFIQYAPAGLAMFDRDMRYLYASHRWLADYGRGDCDLHGLSHYDVFPEIPEKWKDAYGRGLAGEIVRSEGDRFEKMDGSVQWVQWEIHPWYTSQQSIGGIVIFTEDITERKKVENELRQYRYIISSTPDAIALLDRNYHYRIINQSYERFSGISKDQFIGRTVADYLGQDIFEQHIKSQFDRCLQGEVISFEDWFEYKTFGKRYVVVTYFPYFGEDDTIAGVVADTRDITEQKRTEIALQESNELLSLFLQHSPIFAYIKEVTATESRVLKASGNFQQMIGIPGSELVGKTMEELFPAEFAAKITADDWAVVSSGQSLELNEYLNGRTYTTLKFPLSQGGRSLLAGYTIDITERKQMEESLRISLADVQRYHTQMVVLNRMNDLLLSCETRAEAYEVIARSVGHLFTGCSGGLAMREATAPSLRVVATWGQPSTLPATFLSDACWALRRGEPYAVADPAHHVHCQHFATPPQYASLCVPLTVRGENIGLLQVSTTTALAGDALQEWRTLVIKVGGSIKLALSNLKLQEALREQAIHDALTGLFNRRYLDESCLGN